DGQDTALAPPYGEDVSEVVVEVEVVDVGEELGQVVRPGGRDRLRLFLDGQSREIKSLAGGQGPLLGLFERQSIARGDRRDGTRPGDLDLLADGRGGPYRQNGADCQVGWAPRNHHDTTSS